ncbi:AsnC family transcriptional regulator [Methanocalculus chunghsingensis]|uniref:siroheme decarboxylase n=2 Tax=Methanocalculus chunghsingensis TaxID=156457 RepID=A0A8J7W8D7_9EURY|nr:AsnC family transcriptional regulator [Methanocalculus chunghsingensis]
MQVDRIDLLILDALQEDLPLVPRPFEMIADRIGITSADLLRHIEHLQEMGILRGITPVLESRSLGLHAGTLVALHVPDEKADWTIEIINSYPEISHNYRREHHYSLWFTISAPTHERISRILGEIQEKAGLPDEDILNLPTIRSYKIDVRFDCRMEDADGSD